MEFSHIQENTMPQKVLSTLFVKNVKADPVKVTDFSDSEIDAHGKDKTRFSAPRVATRTQVLGG